MSKSRSTTGRTETKPNAPNTHQLAAELGVDATLLDRFVSDHPSPTAPIVLGWATRVGHPQAEPAVLREDVEAWIDGRPDPPQFDTDYEDALRADVLAKLRGGDD